MKAAVSFVPQKVIAQVGVLVVELPIRVTSAANERVHWTARAKRVRAHRTAIALAVGPSAGPAKLSSYPAFRVKLTRIAPKALDAHDNLAHSCKGLVDGIADVLGVDDGDLKRVRWEYAQEKRAPKTYGLRIEIVGMNAAFDV